MTLLILDSGRGSRMGDITDSHPKCMTEISVGETILSRQLALAVSAGLKKVVITTGYLGEVLEDYVRSLDMPLDITFVRNDKFDKTNYIWSIYLARHILDDDIILMHGDLVFDSLVLDEVIAHEGSCMTVSVSAPLPEKDFKAVIEDGKIVKVGIEFFDNAAAAQPLYKLTKQDFRTWLDNIIAYCESGIDEKRTCYAEKALNEVSGECEIRPLDVGELLCSEIDNADDLEEVSRKLDSIKHRSVYMCFSTDVIHSGHIAIIRKAANLGRLTIGVLSDAAVAGYKRFPLLPFEERKTMFENISGVSRVVGQQELSYRENIMRLRPDIVVHGDDWRSGVQRTVREETIALLKEYGGRLVEYLYAYDEKYIELERRSLAELSTPAIRRSRLKKMLSIKGIVTAIEAHSGLTGLIAEKTVVYENGGARQFDAMWISSLCDSTARGKPDIELVDMTSRYRTVDEIMEVTTKPIIFDGDTGGLTEHFVYNVRTLERMGVSMVVIEDKTGLKKNSLFGNEVVQTQADIKDFCAKINAGKRAQKTSDFMICGRIESLILEKGVEDALERAFAYTEAGADAIMIHSRKKDPAEVFEFVEKFRAQDADTPIVVVPTAFDSVTEEEFKARGVNVVIYANQLTRSSFPAMKKAAEMILKNHRAQECDDICMPFGEIIRLIPDDIKEDNYGR
ncbi:MAG: phosphoenolpyruvate mutase [Ruminococcus sp.]|nr:phosphoenolpyruvate mutase [Ruminococcus sp.]